MRTSRQTQLLESKHGRWSTMWDDGHICQLSKSGSVEIQPHQLYDKDKWCELCELEPRSRVLHPKTDKRPGIAWSLKQCGEGEATILAGVGSWHNNNLAEVPVWLELNQLTLGKYSTVDSCYNVPLGKQEKVRYNERFIIKRCFSLLYPMAIWHSQWKADLQNKIINRGSLLYRFAI